MQKIISLVLIIFLTTESCSSQYSDKQTFGTKNIDHYGIAIDFMTKIKNEEYESCYKLLSEDYKESINSEDFEFRMKMLNSLSGDEGFYHYNTTFIGKTAKEGLAIINGKDVKENIMPEYDFTIKSESENDFKSVQIFIRFKNEDSDKISVINYSKHKLLNEKRGMSSMSSNPFIIGNYILIAEINNEIYTDIRGGDLRATLKKTLKNFNKEILIKIELEELANFISANDCTNYSLIHVREIGESMIAPKIRNLAEENGFSVFNHRNKEFKSKSVNSTEVFKRKYEEANWNPVEE